MPDDLPGLSREEGAGRPLTPAQFRKRERERKALEVWIDTNSYAEVTKRLNLRSKDVARELVKRGEERWKEEEQGSLTRHIAAQVTRMYEIIQKSREADDWSAVDRELKAWDRLSRLLGLDAQKDTGDVNIGTFIIGAGATPAQIASIPDGAEVIDARSPWERPAVDVIDGEVEDEDDEGPLGLAAGG